MSERFEELEIDDALAAASRVASAIKNADSYDELAAAIAYRYAQRSDFDRAVDVADTINDPFAMEKSIADIAVLLNADGQEDGAFELIDSIEDPSHAANARSQIAVAHAAAGNVDRALEIATAMDDTSGTLVDIAYQCADQDIHDRAIEIVGLMDFPLGAVWVRCRVARDYHKSGRVEEALEMLNLAFDETEEVEPPNERAAALAELAVRFQEFGSDEKSAQVLLLAMEVAETADEDFQDAAFSQIAAGHARLKQYDSAVSVTEKIDSVYLAASTLVELAIIEHEDESRHDDAVLLLSDAYDLIVEDEPHSQRDEAQHNYLLARIGVTYALFDELDRAIKASFAINELDMRFRALSDVAMQFVQVEKPDDALTMARKIEDESICTGTLIKIARVLITTGSKDQGLGVLTEASRLFEKLERPFDKSQLAASLAIAYAEDDDSDRIGPTIKQALEFARLIADPSAKTAALLTIADACGKTGYELDEQSKEALWEIASV